MQDLRRTLSGVPSCALESSRAGWVWVAVLSSTNKFGWTLISICTPRDVCVSTALAPLPLFVGSGGLFVVVPVYAHSNLQYCLSPSQSHVSFFCWHLRTGLLVPFSLGWRICIDTGVWLMIFESGCVICMDTGVVAVVSTSPFSCPTTDKNCQCSSLSAGNKSDWPTRLQHSSTTLQVHQSKSPYPLFPSPWCRSVQKPLRFPL